MSPRTAVRNAATSAVALTVCMLTAGCAVDQKKEVAQYRRVLDGTDRPEQVTYAPGETLTLDKALRLANQDNERIAMAGEDYLQALINKDRAASAFLPTVSLEPNYTVTDRPATQGGSGAVGTIGGFRVGGETLRRFEAPVHTRANLFNGFGDVARSRRAEAVTLQRRFELLDRQALVLLEVAQVYFQVLRSERQVEVLEASARVQDERVRDTEARQRAGLARPLDVAQTRAQAADTRVALTSARSDARNGRTTLAYLIGVPAVDGPLSYDWEQDLSPAAPLDPVEAFQARAVNDREDVRAAAAAVAAARQSVRAAVSQYYPSVSVDLTAFLYRENYDDASQWTAVLSANIPIFTAGLIRADVRAAWSGLRQAAMFESLTRRLAIQDVRTAHENVTASRARLADLRTQADAARDALNQAEASYQVGLATNLERLTSQSQLLNAELQLTSEQFDQALLLLDLTRFTGRLGPSGTGARNFLRNAAFSTSGVGGVGGVGRIGASGTNALGVGTSTLGGFGGNATR